MLSTQGPDLISVRINGETEHNVSASWKVVAFDRYGSESKCMVVNRYGIDYN
jgi:hypothetical protein